MLLVVDNLLLEHVGLPQVVIVDVHLVIFCWVGRGDHPETFLQKALFSHRAPSWLKVRGWWVVVAPGIILSSPGTGVVSIPISKAQSQSQSLDNLGMSTSYPPLLTNRLL